MLDQTKLQGLIESLVAKDHVSSLVLGIVDNGNINFHSTGMADIEKGFKADEDVAYAIGSATKSFVATAICALVADGKLELETTIRSVIPEFEMYDSYVTEHLTVRDILCHRCGLPRHEFSWYPRILEYQPKDMVGKLKYLEPNQPFRYTMQYQNHMYMLAGYLVERVTGKKWEEYLKERVLEPLGMQDVSFSTVNLAVHPRASKPYAFDGKKHTQCEYADIYMMGAAGSINTTAREMVKWISFHLNNGEVGEQEIIAEKALGESHEPQTIIGKDDPFYMGIPQKKSMSYGLGWFIENYRGRTVIHHGGNIDGYSSLMCFVPGTGFGMVILTNADHALGTMALAYALIDAYFGDSEIDQYANITAFYNKMMAGYTDTAAAILEAAPKNTPMPAAEQMTGSYAHPGYGDLQITVENGLPKGKLGSCTVEFIHVCNNGFFAMVPLLSGDMKLAAIFETDLTGKVNAVSIDLEGSLGHRIDFKKLS